MSRIYYRGKFYDYPIVADNALREPRRRSRRPLRRLSYLWVRVRPPKDQSNARGLRRVQRSAGGSTATSSRPTPRRCGVSRATEIQADWGAQRIKDLSLFRCGLGGDQAQVAAARHGTKSQAGDEPHRGVQLPEVRARDDVGALPPSWSPAGARRS